MNAVDIAVIVVLLASGVLALMRGFVYEVFAMAGWIAAILSAFWCLPLVRPTVRTYISNPTLADVAGGFGVFLVVLLVSSMVSHAIARQVRGTAISSVDRSLGFAFGLLRGLVLASLGFILVTNIVSEPEVLRDAKTRPLMAGCADLLKGLVPAQIAGVKDNARDAAATIDEIRQDKELYDRLQAPKPRSNDAPADGSKQQQPAYDSHGLERLIETTK